MKKATLDAVFDETFRYAHAIIQARGRTHARTRLCTKSKAVILTSLRFDLKDADQEMLEGGNIKISVLDQDVLGTSLIGDFVTDFQAVYFNSGNSHELYRKWVALVDTKNEHDVGVQGYLRCVYACARVCACMRIHY